MVKLIYGVGLNDGSRPSKANGVHLPQYEMWRGMIRRCYSPKEKGKFHTYSDCSVSKNFKSYSYFYDWYNLNIANTDMKYDLDKDLLKKGNRVYSEQNCVLIPRKLNGLLVLKRCQRGSFLIGVTFGKRQNKFQAQISINGENKHIGYFYSEADAYKAYKVKKEEYIKQLAKEYKELILLKAYDALMNYTVEITD